MSILKGKNLFPLEINSFLIDLRSFVFQRETSYFNRLASPEMCPVSFRYFFLIFWAHHGPVCDFPLLWLLIVKKVLEFDM